MNTISQDATRYVEFLEDSGLLTDEHALTVALLHSLVAKLDECTNATQYASITKEIRATQDALPKPVIQQTDEVADFFDELNALEDV